jgi:hypothetical protein
MRLVALALSLVLLCQAATPGLGKHASMQLRSDIKVALDVTARGLNDPLDLQVHVELQEGICCKGLLLPLPPQTRMVQVGILWASVPQQCS